MYTKYTYMYKKYTYMYRNIHTCIQNIQICIQNRHICTQNIHICIQTPFYVPWVLTRTHPEGSSENPFMFHGFCLEPWRADPGWRSFPFQHVLSRILGRRTLSSEANGSEEPVGNPYLSIRWVIQFGEKQPETEINEQKLFWSKVTEVLCSFCTWMSAYRI